MSEHQSPEDFARQRELKKLLEPIPGSPYAPPTVHPNGWRAGVELDGTTGTITSRPTTERSPDWDHLLSSWGYDPSIYSVVEPVHVSTWDGYVKGPTGEVVTKQLWSHRAKIVCRKATDLDVAKLTEDIRKRKPCQKPQGTSDKSTYVLCLSDMQVGKGEGGGTAATIERTMSAIDQSVARVKSLRKAGQGPARIAILSGGDAIENACGWYPNQLYTIDLNRREQVKVARRLFAAAITAHADLADELVFATPDSNHGENRAGGKAVTDESDNADLEIAESLAEVFAANPARYGHVRFVVPRDGAVVILDLGVPVALSHGHRASSGDTAYKKQREWWKGQALGNLDAGAARILITGHFHHAAMVVDYGRTWVQLPSLDGGSAWLTTKTGQHSPPGALSLMIDPLAGELGWRDLLIYHV